MNRVEVISTMTLVVMVKLIIGSSTVALADNCVFKQSLNPESRKEHNINRLMKYKVMTQISANTLLFHDSALNETIQRMRTDPREQTNIRCPSKWFAKKVVEFYEKERLYLYFKMKIINLENGYLINFYN